MFNANQKKRKKRNSEQWEKEIIIKQGKDNSFKGWNQYQGQGKECLIEKGEEAEINM